MLGAFKTLWRRLSTKAAEDSGETVLVVAAVLMGVALTAVALFLNLDAGQRIINRLKSGNASQGLALPACFVNFPCGIRRAAYCPCVFFASYVSSSFSTLARLFSIDSCTICVIAALEPFSAS